MPVSAAWYDDVDSIEEVDEYAEDKLSGIKYGVYSFTKWKYVDISEGSKLIKPIFSSDLLSNETLKNFINNISGAILVVGKLFCVLYFLLNLMEAATRDSFTIEVFIKSLVKLVIIFVIFSESTMTAVQNFAEALEDQLLNQIGEGTDAAACVELGKYVERIKDMSWIQSLGLLFEGSIGSITMLVSIVVTLFVAVGRLIELALYQALLPLGMASIYNGGLNSSGFRYIKKWLALYIQGAIMFATMILASHLGDALSTNGLARATLLSALFDIVVALATAMIIARSKSIANDVMGV